MPIQHIQSKIGGKCHPACLLLPEMNEAEFRELVEDIRQHGQRHPIVVDEDGLILDGRHRYKACKELGILAEGERFTGSEEQKVALVMSENIHRRHLTTAQRGAIAAELTTMRRGTRTDLGKSSGLSNAQAAKVMGVSEPTVERAKRRLREDPEAHAKAKKGELPRKAIRSGQAGRPLWLRRKDVGDSIELATIFENWFEEMIKEGWLRPTTVQMIGRNAVYLGLRYTKQDGALRKAPLADSPELRAKVDATMPTDRVSDADFKMIEAL